MYQVFLNKTTQSKWYIGKRNIMQNIKIRMYVHGKYLVLSQNLDSKTCTKGYIISIDLQSK